MRKDVNKIVGLCLEQEGEEITILSPRILYASKESTAFQMAKLKRRKAGGMLGKPKCFS